MEIKKNKTEKTDFSWLIPLGSWGAFKSNEFTIKNWYEYLLKVKIKFPSDLLDTGRIENINIPIFIMPYLHPLVQGGPTKSNGW